MWKVQVISLSWGFAFQVAEVRKALLAAEAASVIVMAAASNSGGNRQLSWPAREPTIFSIYATDGYGNSYEKNPTQRRHDDNFAILGSCVKGWSISHDEKVYRSGTSTATPIAAGIASMTIHFLRQHSAGSRHGTEVPSKEQCQQISTYPAMRRLFRRMVDVNDGDRGGYCYIQPWLLFNRHASKAAISGWIMSELQQL